MELAIRKRALRCAVRDSISGMTVSERDAADEAIRCVIESLPAFARCAQVLAYWPLRDEVSLQSLLLSAVSSGKRVFLPAIREEEIVYRAWRPGDCMIPGRLGLMEPTGGGEKSPDPDASAVSLVPGRAFSRGGHRLGRGGGFYDRAWRRLARFGPRIGIAYSIQIFAEVPHDERDSVVDMLVCERGVVIDGEG